MLNQAIYTPIRFISIMALKSKNIKCPNCNYKGDGKMKGSGWIELLLWLCYLVPGLIYSIWRRGGSNPYICPKCNYRYVLHDEFVSYS